MYFKIYSNLSDNCQNLLPNIQLYRQNTDLANDYAMQCTNTLK